MPLRESQSARVLAGAFLFAAAAATAADPLRVAAERPDAVCPAGRILAVVHPEVAPGLPPAASRCIAIVPIADVSDASLAEASLRIAKLPDLAGVVLALERVPSPESPDFAARIPFAVKKLSSEARAAAPGAEVALDLTGGVPAGVAWKLPAEDLGPYVDALVLRPDRGRVEVAAVRDRWILAPRGTAESAAGEVLRALEREIASASSITLVGLLAGDGQPFPEADWKSLERLQTYWTSDVSQDPTETKATRSDGSSIDVLRFFDAKTFAPILLLPEDPGGTIST
jgi:hypothetical protein